MRPSMKQVAGLTTLLTVAVVAVLVFLSCDSSPTESEQYYFPETLRGDTNGDGLGYTIADAVCLQNIVVYSDPGQKVDPPIPELMFASEGFRTQYLWKWMADTYDSTDWACDVNADGVPGDLADLMLMERVIEGDAPPIEQPAVPTVPIPIRWGINNSSLTVFSEVGAALVLVRGEADVQLLNNDVEADVRFAGVTTHILVQGLWGGSFEGAFLSVGGEVVDIDFATPEGGRTMPTTDPTDLTPGLYSSPEPFVDSVRLIMTAPQPTDYVLTVRSCVGVPVFTTSGEITCDFRYDWCRWDASGLRPGPYFVTVTANGGSETIIIHKLPDTD